MIYDIMCLLAYVPARLNNDKSVMSRLYAWRMLGILSILKASAPAGGGPEGCNFEKAHRTLRMVLDIILFGWSENFSHQDPEHGHIDNCKRLANCTNNKEVPLTVLRAHSRVGHLQFLRSLEADMADAAQGEGDGAEESVTASTLDKEHEAVCELGIRYQTLQAILSQKLNKQSIQVYITCQYHMRYH